VAALTCEGLTGREGSESGDEEREARTRDWGGHGGWRRGIEGGSKGRIGGGLGGWRRGREWRMGRISFFPFERGRSGSGRGDARRKADARGERTNDWQNDVPCFSRKFILFRDRDMLTYSLKKAKYAMRSAFQSQYLHLYTLYRAHLQLVWQHGTIFFPCRTEKLPTLNFL
jgi:hypothetical protein